MRKLNTVIVAALLGAAATSVSANEVLVTAQPANSATMLSFDVVPTSEVAGFQFTITHPKITDASVDAKSCVADLPRGLTGMCKAANGELGVIVFSPNIEALPKGGVVPVGTVRLNGIPSDEVQVTKVIFADSEGTEVQATGRVASSGLNAEKPGKNAVR